MAMIAAYEPSAERWSALDDRGLSQAVLRELSELAQQRGLGERLTIHGGYWGGADVVIAHPRSDQSALEVVAVDPDSHPALAAACEIRHPA